jgi:CBS domain-containing protein
MKIEQIMSKNVRTVPANATANAAAAAMWDCDCGIIPVVSADGSGELVGVVTDRDLCMAAYLQGKALTEIPVESAMSRTPLSCRPEDELALAESLMRQAQVRRLPIIDGSARLIGIVALADIVRAAAARSGGRTDRAIRPDTVCETLADVTRPRQTIPPTETVARR